jgi:hypothetical protein
MRPFAPHPPVSWLTNVMLIVISVVIVSVLAEIVLRQGSAIWPRSGELKPRANPYQLTARTKLIQPGYSGELVGRDFHVPYSVNGLGFRERELDLSTLRHQHPYVFVGDSYINGWGVKVSDRVTEQLEAQMNVEDKPTPVVNLSAPGLGTFQYADIIRHVATRVSPSLIVVGLFIGNDYLDDWNTVHIEQLASEERSRFSLSSLHEAKLILRFHLRSSAVLNLLKSAMWESAWFRDVFDNLELENDRIALYRQEENALRDELYALTFSAVKEIHNVSLEYRIPIVLVLIPDHLQVLRPRLFSGLDYDRPQRLLKAFLDGEGIPYLDLLDHFLRDSNPARLFFREDKHWNEQGHAFCAQLLRRFFDSRGALIS